MLIETSCCMPRRLSILFLVGLVGIVSAFAPPTGVAAPLGTGFNYQGRLAENGAAANGIFDLRFALYPEAMGGSPSASARTNAGVQVSNGLFTATLDFGTNVFSGAS